jgi:addiction module HigA family antidote
MQSGMSPIHPGEILKQELDELGLSANAFDRALGVPPNRITDILNERRSITTDKALRLARYFGTTPDFWINLQTACDIRRTQIANGEAIKREVQPRAARFTMTAENPPG